MIEPACVLQQTNQVAQRAPRDPGIVLCPILQSCGVQYWHIAFAGIKNTLAPAHTQTRPSPGLGQLLAA
jgi:hypothetical protein